MKPAKSYHKKLIEDLKDPKEAAAYLNAAMEAGDQEGFLVALRNVLEAKGGMSVISKRTKINRVSLYKILSENGNPEFVTILTLFKAANVRLQIAPDISKRNSSKIAA